MKKIIIFMLFAVTVTAMSGCNNANAREQPLAQTVKAELVTPDSTKMPTYDEIIKKSNAEVDKFQSDQRRQKQKAAAKPPKNATGNMQGATLQKVANTDNFTISRPK